MLTLFYHPLASYCHKALIGLYEADLPFTPHLLDLMDPAVRAAHLARWPIGKMPVLEDHGRGALIPEASIILEYLAVHYPAARSLVPADPELAWQARLRDRYFDLYVNDPMGKIVTDNLRPPGRGDPHGVEHARGVLRTAYDVIERELVGPWAVGETFTLADCAAAPALYFASRIERFGAEHRRTAAYLARLGQRPSVARVLREAEPYLANIPMPLVS